MLAPWKGDALTAPIPVEPQLAKALPWPVTVTIQWVATRSTSGDIAQVPIPSREALDLAIVVANVMGVVILGSGDLASLRKK